METEIKIRLHSCFTNFIHLFKELIRRYYANNGSLIAAAVGYYLFLSFIPMLLLALAASSYILGSASSAQQLIHRYVQDFFPAISANTKSGIGTVIIEIVEGRKAATWIGIIGLLWTGSTAITALELGINSAWEIKETRGFIRSRLLAFESFLIMALLLGAATIVTTVIKAIEKSNLSIFGITAGDLPLIWYIMGYTVPIIVAIIAFTLVFKIMPCTKVPLKSAIAGGIFSGILFEILKQLFTIYVTNFAGYSRVYGSLGGIILFLVWMYYFAVITILGAQLGAVIARRERI